MSSAAIPRRAARRLWRRVGAALAACAAWFAPALAQTSDNASSSSTLPSGTLPGGTVPGGTLGAPAPPPVPAPAPAAVPNGLQVAPAMGAPAVRPTVPASGAVVPVAPAPGAAPAPAPVGVAPGAAAAPPANVLGAGPAATPVRPLAPPVPAPVPAPAPVSAAPVAPPPMPMPMARAPLPPAPPPQPAKGLPAGAPQLFVTGGVYSPNPKHRMAIVNGQVVREGAEVAPGLVLEEITPIDVVLAYRGGRYRVMF